MKCGGVFLLLMVVWICVVAFLGVALGWYLRKYDR